jgi:hypothetical protein
MRLLSAKVAISPSVRQTSDLVPKQTAALMAAWKRPARRRATGSWRGSIGPHSIIPARAVLIDLGLPSSAEADAARCTMCKMEDDNIDRVPQHRADRRQPSVVELVMDRIKSQPPPRALFPEARGASPDR